MTLITVMLNKGSNHQKRRIIKREASNSEYVLKKRKRLVNGHLQKLISRPNMNEGSRVLIVEYTGVLCFLLLLFCFVFVFQDGISLALAVLELVL
jgi:hypothetical protein